MIDKSYNIFGHTFDDYVKNQINVRADLYFKDNVTNIFPLYSNKSSWVKLRSSINVEPSSALWKDNDPNTKGDRLARNWELFAGTSNINGMRAGLNNAYTLGGTQELGFRPMPGIESMTLSSFNRWGTLEIAEIKFKCWSINQLEIIEALYMRPGYSLLLEFGHTPYINNSGKLINDISLVDFYKLNDRQQVLDSIKKLRELSNGNYDGMYGVISNFNFVSTNDGGYACSTKIVSIGDVIESLRITNSPLESTQTVSQADIPLNDFKSKLHFTLNNLKDTINKSPRTNNQGNFDLFDITDFLKRNNIPIIDGYSTLVKIIWKVNSINDIKEKSTDTDAEYYIPLGLLLQLTEKLNIPITKQGAPFIGIDYDKEKNLCVSPAYQLTVDPIICLIPFEGNSNDATVILAELSTKIPQEDNWLANFYKSDLNDAFINNFGSYKFNQFKKGTFRFGHTMKILVSVDFVISILDNIMNNSSDNSVNLLSFLDTLMNNISAATGNINDFNVSYDKETNKVRIQDVQSFPSETDSGFDAVTIPSFGLPSFVLGMSLQSQISSRLGSMISIGAAATGETLGMDATSFSLWNKGLRDRTVDFSKQDSTFQISSPLGSQTVQAIDKLSKHLVDIYTRGTYDGKSIDECRNIYRDKFIKIKQSSDSPELQGLPVIPLVLGLDMDGISGVRVGERFNIPSDRLPNGYKDKKGNPKVSFIVTGIEHSVQGNKWVTVLRSQMTTNKTKMKFSRDFNI